MADRLSPEEAGVLLGRSRTTILRWYAEDRLAGLSYLGRITFAREDVERIRTTGRLPKPGDAKRAQSKKPTSRASASPSAASPPKEPAR